MKSFIKVDTMLRHVETALAATADGESRRVMAAMRDVLRWARHDYVQDYQVTQHFPAPAPGRREPP